MTKKLAGIEKLDKKKFRVPFSFSSDRRLFYYNPRGELLDKVNEIIEVLNARHLKRGKEKG